MSKIILMLSQYAEGLKRSFRENGYRVVEDRESIIDLDEKQIRVKLVEWKEREKISYAFSMNFSSIVAEYCFSCDIIYISWMVDCPHVSLLSQSIEYSTNRVFIFDYAQWKEMDCRGRANVYYLPLATDVDLFWNTINSNTEAVCNKFVSDVSFMGNLYDKTPHNLYDQIRYLPSYVKGYLEGLMKVQMMIWGKNLVHSAIADNVWNEIRKNVHLNLETGYEEHVYELFIETIIYKKIPI